MTYNDPAHIPGQTGKPNSVVGRQTGGGVLVPNKPKARPKNRPKAKPKNRPRKQPASQAPWYGPISNKQAGANVNATAQLKYGPQYQALRAQDAANTVMGRNTGDWYNQYLQAVNQARTQNLQGGLATTAAIGQLGQGVGQLAGTLSQQQFAGMNADAASRGAKVDPGLSRTALQAAMVRLGDNNRMAAGNAQNTQGENAYLADVGRIGAGQKLQALMQNQSGRRALDQQRTDLKAQEGAFKVDYRNQLRGQERTYENNRAQLAQNQAAINLNYGKAVADTRYKSQVLSLKAQAQQTAQRNADRQYQLDVATFGQKQAAQLWKQRNGDAKYKLDRQKFGWKKANDLWKRRHPNATKKSGGVSTTQGNAFWTKISQGRATADLHPKNKALHTQLVAKYGAIIGSAAWDLHRYGKLTPPTVRALTRAGYRVRGRYPIMSSGEWKANGAVNNAVGGLGLGF